eukprot:c22257_g1_i2 orf=271-2145(-)
MLLARKEAYQPGGSRMLVAKYRMGEADAQAQVQVQEEEEKKVAQLGLSTLPDECWEIIFSFLNHSSNWQAVSVTCRQFLSVSNRIRPSLAICNGCCGLLGGLPRILHRFTGLKEIDLSNFVGNLARPILQIANSCPQLQSLNLHGQKGLPLEALLELGRCCQNLRILNCSRLHLVQDHDVITITVAFPHLRNLDISYPQIGFRPPISIVLPTDASMCPGMVTDSGMEALATGLVHLHSLNISGHYMLSDFSLQALAMGCKELEEFIMFDCPFVTDTGLEFLGSHCSNLKTLAVNGPRITTLGIEIFLSWTRTLVSLDLSHMAITDELLSQLGELHLPLKRLMLTRCKGLTSAGVVCLAKGCPQITHLNLEGAHCLSDENMAAIANYLRDLCFICLNYCSMLTDATFFSLLEGCTHLEELYMESTGLGWGTVNVRSMQTCIHLQKLKLAWNKPVGDATLRWVGRLCPSLLYLDLSHCLFVSDVGLDAISHGCPRMKDLCLRGCKKVHEICKGEGFEELEHLDLEGSGVTDWGLQTVGRNCRHLMSLGLQGCSQITDLGLKKLMDDCKDLREISLKGCQGVNIEALAWMVFYRPSLRKLVLPPSPVSEAQRRRLKRHGCELDSPPK